MRVKGVAGGTTAAPSQPAQTSGVNFEPDFHLVNLSPLTISLHCHYCTRLYYCIIVCMGDNNEDSDVLLISKIIFCVFSEDSGAREGSRKLGNICVLMLASHLSLILFENSESYQSVRLKL